MFNSGFYPTPDHVIEKMLEPMTIHVNGYRVLRGSGRVLEPSAGKGNIVDYMTKWYRVKKEDIFVCEIEPDLRAILKEKGYQIVDTDFLEYKELVRYDLIVMNPDFAHGAEHLLHAWELLEDKGRVVCLLNAETIRNPSSKRAEVLNELIRLYGETEFVGAAFAKSERPTNVEVVIVRMTKNEALRGKMPKMSADEFDWDEEVAEPEYSASPLANRDILGALVAEYNEAAELLVQKFKVEARYRFAIRNVITVKAAYYEKEKTHAQRIESKKREDEQEVKQTLRQALDELKKLFWSYVFDKTKIGQQATSNFVKEFEKLQGETSRMAFTVENIMRLIEMFVDNREQIILDCICSVFDEATKYHKDNCVHGEGWFTNKGWKIGRRIILPYGVRHDGSRYKPWSTSYNDRPFYEDLDKALCFISNRKFDDIHSLYKAMGDRLEWANSHPNERYDRWWDDSTFFRYRFYKKQTVHLEFKDPELLEAFNMAAAKGKKWVGDGVGAK